MPARMIGRYRIGRRLGFGGMGEVFLAQDTELDRQIALKIMSVELAKDPNQRKRFRTEARAASGLNHPHICVIHEVGESEDGRPFLAMEYIRGQTLDMLLRDRRLKIREVIDLGIEVAEALQAAHARGLVHRDIKPGNIMVSRESGAKVLDFGLAKSYGPDDLSGSLTSVAHTRTGMLVGTPQYMSPEQALGRTLDPRTDIFSFGIVLYELLVGQRPFLGPTASEIINNIVNQPAAPLGLDNPVFSPALDRIVLKCLEKDPQHRCPSAAALALELRKLKEDSEKIIPTPAISGQGQSYIPVLSTVGSPRETTTRMRSKRALAFAVAFPLLAALGVLSWLLLRGDSPSKSLAVLPFVNISADKADEYLSDGMTEELCNTLARIPGLRVPGSRSSFAFKGRNEDGIFRIVGERLQVQTVLEGSVRKDGDKLRVTAQLINVRDGFQLWSEKYDRDLTNIFSIQTDIASRVAAALKVRLLGHVKEPTANIEAYKLYLQGRHLWNRRTGAAITQAIDAFNQAIAEDPAYAQAYAGLADCHAILSEYSSVPPRESLPEARKAAWKALELDRTLAEPHVVLGWVKSAEWDWSGAEQDYLKAIALNPKYATAYHWYGISLRAQGFWDKALARMEQAQEADPLSPVINVNVASFLYQNGRRDEGIKMLQKFIALDPTFAPARKVLGELYSMEGRLSDAIAQLEAAHAPSENTAYALESLGRAYALASRTNDAQQVLIQLREFQAKGGDTWVAIAAMQYALADVDGALATLERALLEHAGELDTLNYSPSWKELRPHPRVQAILKTMKLVK